MSPAVILGILMALAVLQTVLEQLATWLNLRYQPSEVPSEVSDIYDQAEYARALQYKRANARFGFIESEFTLILLLVVLGLGLLGQLDTALMGVISTDWVRGLVLLGIVYLATDLLSIPFSWYSTFVIEERFGFNRTTPQTFVLDKLKGYALTLVIGGLLIGVLLWLTQRMGMNFWWIFWIIATAFTLFMQVFYTTLIVPLFNKLTPLEEGELQARLQGYAQTVNFPLSQTLVMDSSKRSSKANAFFSGLGRQKRIVLFDTLINDFSDDEVVAVMAHEVGHYKLRHIPWFLVLSIAPLGVMLFLLAQVIFSENLSLALGATQQSAALNLIAFGILLTPVNLLLSLVLNHISRAFEYQADAYAKHTFDGEALASALKKLTQTTLSTIVVHPLMVALHYSHPPMLQRLKALKQDAPS